MQIFYIKKKKKQNPVVNQKYNVEALEMHFSALLQERLLWAHSYHPIVTPLDLPLHETLMPHFPQAFPQEVNTDRVSLRFILQVHRTPPVGNWFKNFPLSWPNSLSTSLVSETLSSLVSQLLSLLYKMKPLLPVPALCPLFFSSISSNKSIVCLILFECLLLRGLKLTRVLSWNTQLLKRHIYVPFNIYYGIYKYILIYIYIV